MRKNNCFKVNQEDEIIDHLKIPQDKIKVIYEGSMIKSQIKNQELLVTNDQRPKTIFCL